MTNSLRAREKCPDVLGKITGLRMNRGYVRPGGLAQELPADAAEAIRSWVREISRTYPATPASSVSAPDKPQFRQGQPH